MMRNQLSTSTLRAQQRKRNRLAISRARHLLSQRITGTHSTVLSVDTLQELASKHEVRIEILSTHVHTDYTSLVYEIF